jgi:protein-L-isoaspartate(D-aspartate) O-methyltransferase
MDAFIRASSRIASGDLRRGDRVIHVGCGVGYYTAIIAEVVGPSGQVIGLEIDADLAARARENLAQLKSCGRCPCRRR